MEESLQLQLEEKDRRIAELEAMLGQKTSSWNLSSRLNQTRQQRRGMCVQSIKFLSNVVGNVMTIQFPKELPKDMGESPSLYRQESISQSLTEILSRIQQVKWEILKVQNEIDQNAQEIRSEAEARIQAMKASYLPTLDPLNQEMLTQKAQLEEALIGCILIGQTTKNSYIVESYDPSYDTYRLMKYTDSFGIPLQSPQQVSFKIEELESMKVLPSANHAEFYETISNLQITVMYQILYLDNEEKLCCPVHIEPQGLSLQDYEIKINNSTQEIENVVNRQEGAVRFTARRIDERCNFVMESIVEVFTQRVNENIINICHVHLDDMSNEVPIEVVYILDNQSWQDYQDFNVDARGIPLRYKIIVRKGQVDTVLYNTGLGTVQQLQFIEKTINIDQYMKANELDIVQVDSVPTGLIGRDWKGAEMEIDQIFSKYEPQDFCHHRHIEEIPGLVDISVICSGGDILQNKKQVSLPVCQLSQLNQIEEQEINFMFNKQDEQIKEDTSNSAQVLQQMLDQYNSNSFSSNKQEFFNQLSSEASKVRKLMQQDNNFASQHQRLIQQVDRSLRAISMELRFG